MYLDIPASAKLRNSTKLFSAETLPNALQNWHQTPDGVWAKIVLKAGTACYEIMGNTTEQMTLSSKQSGIIEPCVPHRLTPSADAQIQIHFYELD